MFTKIKSKSLSIGALAVMSAMSFSEDVLAQDTTGIFEDGTDKGEQILNDLMNGPAKLVAGGAILTVAILFMLGKLPVKMAALIVVGALLLGSSQNIIDFLFN